MHRKSRKPLDWSFLGVDCAGGALAVADGVGNRAAGRDQVATSKYAVGPGRHIAVDLHPTIVDDQTGGLRLQYRRFRLIGDDQLAVAIAQFMDRAAGRREVAGRRQFDRVVLGNSKNGLLSSL